MSTWSSSLTKQTRHQPLLSSCLHLCFSLPANNCFIFDIVHYIGVSLREINGAKGAETEIWIQVEPHAVLRLMSGDNRTGICSQRPNSAFSCSNRQARLTSTHQTVSMTTVPKVSGLHGNCHHSNLKELMKWFHDDKELQWDVVSQVDSLKK